MSASQFADITLNTLVTISCHSSILAIRFSSVCCNMNVRYIRNSIAVMQPSSFLVWKCYHKRMLSHSSRPLLNLPIKCNDCDKMLSLLCWVYYYNGVMLWKYFNNRVYCPVYYNCIIIQIKRSFYELDAVKIKYIASNKAVTAHTDRNICLFVMFLYLYVHFFS